MHLKVVIALLFTLTAGCGSLYLSINSTIMDKKNYWVSYLDMVYTWNSVTSRNIYNTEVFERMSLYRLCWRTALPIIHAFWWQIKSSFSAFKLGSPTTAGFLRYEKRVTSYIQAGVAEPDINSEKALAPLSIERNMWFETNQSATSIWKSSDRPILVRPMRIRTSRPTSAHGLLTSLWRTISICLAL